MISVVVLLGMFSKWSPWEYDVGQIPFPAEK
jgi:hypothetical protein